ncbi:hypothetical protein V7S43_017601 [Phytophthora oleae]|uniref:Uncharacterized protein n=1 Tax=Phytophthora oleae TaxID=2107226 RepID=A0ABD3ET26_9STRA
MRSLQRILSEMKTKRFVDQMIHQYSDIRLAATTRAKTRKRPRAEATGVRKPPVNQDGHDRGEQSDMAAELSTSFCCRTESERSSRSSSTMLDVERSQSAKGLEGQQHQQEEARFDRWRMSEAPTVSEYGSTLSSTRLTRLLEEESDEYDQENTLESSGTTQQETEDNQERSSLSECDNCSSNLESTSASTQSPVGDQIEEQSQLSEGSTESPPTSSTTETLPRLRPTAPTQCVVPNCCDYFTSPHPHYPKEVIGLAQKVEEPLNDERSQPDSESTSEAPNNGRRDHSDGRSGTQANNNLSGDGRDSDFEMWDYVCPQHARRGYANEWV